MSRDVPPWIRRGLIGDSPYSLCGKMLDEPSTTSSIRIVVIEAVELGNPSLECGYVVGLDTAAIDILIKVLDARIWERTFSIEEGSLCEFGPGNL